MLVLFDKNTPEPLRKFLIGHDIRTIKDMGWHPQIENGSLIMAAEVAGFEVMVTADQSIIYQQNLKDRKLALVVLGSNIWHVVETHVASIVLEVRAASSGSYAFIEMSLPPKRPWPGKDT